MEIGSGSLTESGSSSASSPTTESINGLKFGKKIYFEDVGVAATAKTRPGSSSGSGAPAKKLQGGQQQQPPRCQVEGCKVDLSDAKAYYSRHKVCGMHSKSPKVIVAGLEQRFCQQCSRFHQLPEFDQGKRSCRRRLAGHNERRRKPRQESVLSSRYDNSTRVGLGGFTVDFIAHPRPPGRVAWPTANSSDHVHGNQTAVTGMSVPHPLENSSQNPQSNPYLLGSAGGNGFSSSEIPLGECFNGVSVADSTCALSLLSNQPWGSRNQGSGLGVVNAQGATLVQSTVPCNAAANHYPNPSWGFKGNEGSSSSSYNMHPDLHLGQISQPLDSQFSGDLEQNRRYYLEFDDSRADNPSSQHINWSL